MRARWLFEREWSTLPEHVLADTSFGQGRRPGVHVVRRLVPQIFSTVSSGAVLRNEPVSDETAESMIREFSAAKPRIVRAHAAYKALKAANRVRGPGGRVENAADPFLAHAWRVTASGEHRPEDVTGFFEAFDARRHRPATPGSLRAHIEDPLLHRIEAERLGSRLRVVHVYSDDPVHGSTRRGGASRGRTPSAADEAARALLATLSDDRGEGSASGPGSISAWAALLDSPDLDTGVSPRALHLAASHPPSVPVLLGARVVEGHVLPLDRPVLDRLVQAVTPGSRAVEIGWNAADCWRIGIESATEPFGLRDRSLRAALRVGSIALAALGYTERNDLGPGFEALRRRWAAALKAIRSDGERSGDAASAAAADWAHERLWVRLHRIAFETDETLTPSGAWSVITGVIPSAVRRIGTSFTLPLHAGAVDVSSAPAPELARLNETAISRVGTPVDVIGYVIAAALESAPTLVVRTFVEEAAEPSSSDPDAAASNRAALERTWNEWIAAFRSQWGHAMPRRRDGEQAVELPSFDLAGTVLRDRLRRLSARDAAKQARRTPPTQETAPSEGAPA